MLFKYLDILKQIEENDLKDLLESTFEYFSSAKSKKIESNIMLSKNLKAGFSSLIRFYRSINSNKKIEEEQIIQIIKEIFKGKNIDLNSVLLNQINLIQNIQNKRVNFSQINLSERITGNKIDTESYENLAKREFLLNNILEFKSFSWKININISNNISNRILYPEIVFMFSLEDGKTYYFLIDIKVFQELRRLLTIHIKRIMENEQIVLLKNY